LHPVVEGRLEECGPVRFGDGGASEGGFEGVPKRCTFVERTKDEVVFARKALVVDRVVVTVDGEVDLFALRAVRSASLADKMNSDSI
jgi:hypothetical protein